MMPLLVSERLTIELDSLLDVTKVRFSVWKPISDTGNETQAISVLGIPILNLLHLFPRSQGDTAWRGSFAW